jgi:protease I
MSNKKIIIPLPAYGFDPSEVAIPWQILMRKNIQVTFATPNGLKAEADCIMLSGKKLGIWRPILKARKDAIDAYQQMVKTEAFNNPLSYSAIKENNFDGLLLPGGHDKGVKEYLESSILQQFVASFFKAEKPVAAICHGVVLAARSIDTATGKSVIYNYQTTALLKSQELTAYTMTRLWLKDYYLTYPNITVEQEVRAALADKINFINGPTPLFRDNLKHLERGFVVKDKNYLSARWPGDAYKFAITFSEMLNN